MLSMDLLLLGLLLIGVLLSLLLLVLVLLSLLLRRRKEIVLLLHSQLGIHHPTAYRKALHLLELHLRLQNSLLLLLHLLRVPLRATTHAGAIATAAG